MRDNVLACFEKGQISEIIILLSKYFGKNYSLKDLFKDDQQYLLNYIVADGLKKAKELYNIIYHDNSTLLRFMKENRLPSPKPLLSAAEIVLNMEIAQLLSDKTLDLEKLQKTITNSKHMSIRLDSELLSFEASEKVADEFSKLLEAPENIETVKRISRFIQLLSELPITLDLWQSQNTTFKIAQNQYLHMKEKTDEASQAWV
jgi:hypothetical protein